MLCNNVERVDGSAVERWRHDGRRRLFHGVDLRASLETDLQHGALSQRGAPSASHQLVGQRIPGVTHSRYTTRYYACDSACRGYTCTRDYWTAEIIITRVMF